MSIQKRSNQQFLNRNRQINEHKYNAFISIFQLQATNNFNYQILALNANSKLKSKRYLF